MKKVWASKWNERAYKNRNHDTLCIGILIQEHIRADYAFVTYTNHPVSRDSSQIYTDDAASRGIAGVGFDVVQYG
ncbi:unnamed protein product [Lactuca virosa]|uniref:Uncharacterized protein n=1 Tax=Lactuca virosa TaxID=75947 RepID=A0AAU9MZV8_9ASTR|nr:unnamed protein product [Lactuca virosa]